MNTFMELAEKVVSLGGRLFFVGGCVRDEVMGRTPHDYDFVVVGLAEKTFRQAFPQANMTGKSFPVFRLFVGDEEVEIAFARTETKSGSGHNGFSVVFGPDVTLRDDLVRRDLTVNAMAKDVISGEIFDPFDGRGAVARRELDAVSEHFCEDPLRVLRAARMASVFGYTVSEKTKHMMQACRDEVVALPSERVWCELVKALSASKPSVFFSVLRDAGVLDAVFPEVAGLVGKPFPQSNSFGDAFEHSLTILDAVSSINTDVVIRFAALVHDLGLSVASFNHDIAGEKLIRSWKDGRFPARVKSVAAFVARQHKIIAETDDLGVLVDALTAGKRSCALEALRIVICADSHRDIFALRPDVVARVFSTVEVPDNISCNGERAREFVRNIRIKRLESALIELDVSSANA